VPLTYKNTPYSHPQTNPHTGGALANGGSDPATGRANYVTLKFGNECPMPIIAAVHYKTVDGKWTTGGWFSLAPGQTREVARTRNTIFYVRRLSFCCGEFAYLEDCDAATEGKTGRQGRGRGY
jgi:hypothetical protein